MLHDKRSILSFWGQYYCIDKGSTTALTKEVLLRWQSQLTYFAKYPYLLCLFLLDTWAFLRVSPKTRLQDKDK